MIPWWLNPWAEARRLRALENNCRSLIVVNQLRRMAADTAFADQRELKRILQARSEATRKGNLTKAANRRAKQDQITEKLKAEVTA